MPLKSPSSVPPPGASASGSAPIVIRGRAASRPAGRWLCACGFIVLSVMLIAVARGRSAGTALLAGFGLLLFFALLFVYIDTQRVELDGDEIVYRNLFGRRSLRRDQIKSARGAIKNPGRQFSSNYLVIEPIDPRIPAMKIRTDFFSYADVKTIRTFFGSKLKRRGKKGGVALSP